MADECSTATVDAPQLRCWLVGEDEGNYLIMAETRGSALLEYAGLHGMDFWEVVAARVRSTRVQSLDGHTATPQILCDGRLYLEHTHCWTWCGRCGREELWRDEPDDQAIYLDDRVYCVDCAYEIVTKEVASDDRA